MSIAIVAAVGLTVLVLGAMAWFRRQATDDLGSVSDHWIAEQRSGPDGDMRR